VSSVPGAEVEDNIYSISVHYRNCPRSELDKIKDVVTHVQVGTVIYIPTVTHNAVTCSDCYTTAAHSLSQSSNLLQPT
jgi:trehalose-6-phosphatase